MSAFLHLLHLGSWRELLTSLADIAVVWVISYRVLLLVRGTRGAQMMIGLGLVAGGLFAARWLELATVSWLLDHLLTYAIIFLIVIFQHDIRRALTRLGQQLFGGVRSDEMPSVFEEVIKAAEQLARARIGGLIVLERKANLHDFFSEPGETIDARVSKELLVALFLPDPLNTVHDGAVVIRNLRISRAGVVLPLSGRARLDKRLGTRHRAAFGISEETDAVVIVISEERGEISLCFGGDIARDLDAATLRTALLGLFAREPEAPRPAPVESLARRITGPLQPVGRRAAPAEAALFSRLTDSAPSEPAEPVGGAAEAGSVEAAIRDLPSRPGSGA